LQDRILHAKGVVSRQISLSRQGLPPTQNLVATIYSQTCRNGHFRALPVHFTIYFNSIKRSLVQCGQRSPFINNFQCKTFV
jgi:hypothetical protein